MLHCGVRGHLSRECPKRRKEEALYGNADNEPLSRRSCRAGRTFASHGNWPSPAPPAAAPASRRRHLRQRRRPRSLPPPPASPLPLSHHTTTPSAVRGRRRLAVSAGPSPALACTGDVPAAPFGAFLPAATRRRPWPPSARRAPPRPLLLLLALLLPPCLVLLPSFGSGPGRTTSPTPLSPPPPLRRVFLPLVSARLTAVTAHTAGVR